MELEYYNGRLHGENKHVCYMQLTADIPAGRYRLLVGKHPESGKMLPHIIKVPVIKTAYIPDHIVVGTHKRKDKLIDAREAIECIKLQMLKAAYKNQETWLVIK